MKYKKFVFIAVAGALSGALAAAESMISVNILPGGKAGLSNIAVMIIIYMYGMKEALSVTSLKSIISLMITGSVTGFLYSLCGGLAAVIVMSNAMKIKGIGSVGVGVLGAFFNNIVQTTVAAVIMSNIYVLNYMGIIGPVSIITGGFTGYTSSLCVKYLNKKGIYYV